MGTSNVRHHVNLAGPVKSAIRELERSMPVLVADGPEAYADQVDTAAEIPGRHELAAEILRAVAAAIRDPSRWS